MATPLPATRARIGLILPSSNRLSEVQFNRYAPTGVSVLCTRLRNRPRGAVQPLSDPARIEEAALALADAGCEIIVYHCTGASMSAGVAGEQRVVELIEAATGVHATSTAGSIVAALRRLDARRIVFLAPSSPESGDQEARFLGQAGFEVLSEHSMGLLGAEQYEVPPPQAWLEMAVAAADPRADAYFLACTTTQAPEALEAIEAALGRPAVASNQATLWHCLRSLGIDDSVEGLGQLMALDPAPAMAR